MSKVEVNQEPRQPLPELIGQIRAIGNTLNFLSQETRKLPGNFNRWTLCFYAAGRFAGAVENHVWQPDSGAIASVHDYQRERRIRLIQAGLIPESEMLVVGDGLEDSEWEEGAATAGVQLPRLIHPVDLDSDEWDEVVDAATRFKDSHFEPPTEPFDKDEFLSSQQGNSGFTGVRPAKPPKFEGELAVAIERVSEIAHEFEWVLQLLGFLQEHLDNAATAAQRLPSQVLEALDGLDRNGWRARFRRDVLMPIARWPWQKNDRRHGLPRTHEDIAKALSAYEPRSHWEECLERLDTAHIDLHAALSETSDIQEKSNPTPESPNDVTDQSMQCLNEADPFPSAPLPDGPHAPDKWVYKGVVCDRLTPKPWRFANALWNAMPLGVQLVALAEPVNQDHADIPTVPNARNWMNKANAFFRKYGIPLVARVANETAILEETSEKHVANT